MCIIFVLRKIACFSNSTVLFIRIPDSCDVSKSSSTPVYGIVLLQFIGAGADSLSANGQDATSWGQPDPNVVQCTIMTVAANMPPLIDALSTLRTTLHREIEMVTFSSRIFCANFFHSENLLTV
jgi:hypothetical protein